MQNSGGERGKLFQRHKGKLTKKALFLVPTHKQAAPTKYNYMAINSSASEERRDSDQRLKRQQVREY